MDNIEIYKTYFNEIKEKGKITELSHRTALENLLNKIKPNKIIQIIHEPKRDRDFGAPDFRVEVNGAIIGYIETKDIGTNILKTIKTKQIQRYLSLTENLMITNYHEFCLIHNTDDQEEVTLFDENDIIIKKSELDSTNIRELEKLFEVFFFAEPIRIGKSKKLAQHFASRGRILKEYIFDILETKQDDEFTNK